MPLRRRPYLQDVCPSVTGHRDTMQARKNPKISLKFHPFRSAFMWQFYPRFFSIGSHPYASPSSSLASDGQDRIEVLQHQRCTDIAVYHLFYLARLDIVSWWTVVVARERKISRLIREQRSSTGPFGQTDCRCPNSPHPKHRKLATALGAAADACCPAIPPVR
ncbi:zinc finger protein [Striga asiatica]|uniref:Zinc finger protein n=1 Tax=Striga asiatica TaxID=4170 RepID=A0A5A7RFB9_STRAF|nr:zinc finger protein [Striga asiatica]